MNEGRRADLSRLHAVVPVRTIGGGKSRLGRALDAEERETLIVGMLLKELRVLAGWGGCEQVHVVSPDPGLMPLADAAGARPILQPGDGLNEGIRLGRSAALRLGATAVLVLPADLPLLSAPALDRLRDAADAALAAGSSRPIVVVVPADARRGTNTLLLSPADIIEPSFGPESLERHLRSAAEAEASVQVVTEPELAFDLDTPQDLARLDPAILEELVELGRTSFSPLSARPGEQGHGLRGLYAVPLPPDPTPLAEIRPGDDLAALVVAAWRQAIEQEPDLAPVPGDVLVVTQKAVSKAEGRIVDLRTVTPRREALEFAERFGRDARQVEVVLRESAQILRMERGIVISRTRHGFVCANAGVDASNVREAETVTLLPEDPDRSARELRRRVGEEMGLAPAVIITDSFGRPWRMGIVDVAVGVAGFAPLDDQRGRPDTAGRIMRTTVVAVADEIASAAELAAGKTSGRPFVLVRGATLPPGDGSAAHDLVMPPELDLFR